MPAVKLGSRPPWVGLGAAVWVQIASGSSYTFPLYSHALKSVLGYSQQQLGMLGVANDVGENLGIIPGLFCNRLSPWVVILIGASFSFLGYGLVWLSLSNTLPGVPYWLLWIALCVATNGCAWLSTGVLVTNMRNFPLSRGTVAGILKGYIGLSAAVYTELYTGVLHNSSANLLLFLALGSPTVCILMMYFVRPCSPSLENNSSEQAHFTFTQAASVLLGVYLLTTTILDNVFLLNDLICYAILAVMILLLLAPLAVPLKMTLYPTNRTSSGSDGSTSNLLSESDDVSEPLLPSSSEINLGESGDVSDMETLLYEGEGAVTVQKKRKPRRGEDFNFREALVKADFWLLFLVYFVGVGSGVTVLNNLAQIGIAAGFRDTTVLLSLFSFCNFVGRLGGGVVSEYFVRSIMLPRPALMTCAQIIMIFIYILFAVGIKSTVYASTALLGICYGVQFSVMVPTASELFGLKQFGKIFNFIGLGNPLGALIFSNFAGYFYDLETAKQHHGASDSCFGPDCFRLTFFVLAGICCLGVVLSIVLSVRIKPVYQMLYASGSFRLPKNSAH